MLQNNILENEDRNVAPVPEPQLGIGIYVGLFERDAERAELHRHLLAEMAAAAAVKPNLYR